MVPAKIRDDQVISVDLVGSVGDPFEKTGFMHSFEGKTRLAFFVDRGDLDLGRIICRIESPT